MVDLFKDILPAILQNKNDILEEEKDYNAYVVNRALSYHNDCVFQANQMNMYPFLPGKMQFQFLLNSIRKGKRPFRPWQKLETIENLEIIKEYYKYSNEKSKETLSLLNEGQIGELKKRLDRGGIKKK